jgi:alpha-tubulin suppressor-like RCC1 family protein
VGALDTLEAYDVRSLRAVAKDAAGEIISDVPFTWTSSNNAVATVQSPAGVLDGAITGVDRGTVAVTATSPNGKSATATRVVVIKYRSITAATMHTCDIASGGIAYCWGLNGTDARLGDSNIGDGKFQSEPYRVPGERGFTQLVSFARFTCGLKTDRKAYCWGNNSWGTLGDGTNKAFSSVPVAVAGNNTFVTLSAGGDHACGVTTTNALVCWGHNDWGQFGVGNTSTPNAPVVSAGGMQFRAVMASSSATCGVTMAGTAYCWGGNGNGETGDGERIAYGNVYKTAPSLVVGGLTFAALTGGNHFACGLTVGNQAYCWGANGGRFGNGNTTDSSSPVAVAGGHLFTQISSGYGHSCGVTTASDVACWGGNGNGQIGTASMTLRVPFLLPNLKAAEVAASGIGTGAGSHSCAISRDRLTVLCWGRNDVGQLGNGTTTSVAAINPTPSIVVGQKPL